MTKTKEILNEFGGDVSKLSGSSLTALQEIAKVEIERYVNRKLSIIQRNQVPVGVISPEQYLPEDEKTLYGQFDECQQEAANIFDQIEAYWEALKPS